MEKNREKPLGYLGLRIWIRALKKILQANTIHDNCHDSPAGKWACLQTEFSSLALRDDPS